MGEDAIPGTEEGKRLERALRDATETKKVVGQAHTREDSLAPTFSIGKGLRIII